MAHTQTTDKSKRPSWLQSVRDWLAHPTSEVVPPIFGDTVPPEMKVFEAEVDEAQHEVREVPAPPAVHDGRSKRVRRNKSSVSSS
jgi:hypothetical protein